VISENQKHTKLKQKEEKLNSNIKELMIKKRQKEKERNEDSE
jgi:hypothetical protein